MPYIEGPISYICNLSLNQGIFPDILKIVNVIPLDNKEGVLLFNNYRPASLLILFLDENKILFKYQFGFRK